MLTQVMFTGVQALSLVSVIGLLIGASIIIQTNMMVPADGELIGRVLVAVVLRELAPLITAIVVAGRSGTAIATELGNMKVNSEVLALSSLGVDPLRYVVLAAHDRLRGQRRGADDLLQHRQPERGLRASASCRRAPACRAFSRACRAA